MMPERSGFDPMGTSAPGAVSPANPFAATSTTVEIQTRLRGSDLVLSGDSPFLSLPDHPHSRVVAAVFFSLLSSLFFSHQVFVIY